MTNVPFVKGSETSEAAARRIASSLGRLEAQVYVTLAERPRTCDAVEVATGLSHQTASARIRGLAKRGLIVKAGWKGLTRSGSEAEIWKVANG